MAGRAEAQRFFNHQARQTHPLPASQTQLSLASPVASPDPILGLRTLLP